MALLQQKVRHTERKRSEPTAALIRKLEITAPLAPEEKAVLLRLPLRLKTVATHQDIARAGDSPSESCPIVAGFAHRYILTAEGKRQTLSFHIAGDILDLQSLHIDVMDHSLATLVPSSLVFIQHNDRLCCINLSSHRM